MVNLGFAYVASALRAAGHEVRVAVPGKEPFAELAAAVRGAQPDLVGFSGSTSRIMVAAKLAGLVKQLAPGVKIVIGGFHASGAPEQTLNELPMFDFAVFGEGEQTAVELAAALAEGRSPAGIDGLAWRENGKARRGGERILGDVDALVPPAIELFAIEKTGSLYRKTPGRPDLPVLTSRGCPNSCTICTPVSGRRVRFRDPARVAAEIDENASRFGCGSVCFYDAYINISAEHLRGVCEQIIARDLHRRLWWYCFGRISDFSLETARLMARAGCRVIAFGMESGDQEILDRNNRRATLQQGIDAVRFCRQAGIETDMGFIIGMPYETRETVKRTIRFALRADPDYISANNLVPYPETQLMEMARRGEANLRLIDDRWEAFEKQAGSPLALADASPLWLLAARLWLYARFYFRPRKIGRLWGVVSPRGLMVAVFSAVTSVAKKVFRLSSGKLA